MNQIRKRFSRPRVLLPVVHCIDQAQALRAATVAFEEGADGVWLINQGGMSITDVTTAAILVVELAEEIGNQSGKTTPFVGINFLGQSTAAVGACMLLGLNGVWTDNYAAVKLKQAKDMREAGALHFGGTAFKYQKPVAPADYGKAALAAVGAGVDVVTTSGTKTGSAPDVEKVAAMRRALDESAASLSCAGLPGSEEGHALAIASGVTPENVGVFLPYVDAYLVATGIEERFGVFDPLKVRDLRAATHGWTP